MRATLTLHLDVGEQMPSGGIVAEVAEVIASQPRDGGVFPRAVPVCYIERAGPLSAVARLGREPVGIPLIVYVRREPESNRPEGVKSK